MYPIFKKENLTLAEDLRTGEAGGRGAWRAAEMVLLGEDFPRDPALLRFLLEAGAGAGDTRSMCQLARTLYEAEPEELPTALSWWHRAARQQDPDALRDLAERDILRRIRDYRGSQAGPFYDAATVCAMLTDWFLTGLGRDCWEALPLEERRQRVRRLTKEACRQLSQAEPSLFFSDNPTPEDGAGQGEKAAGEPGTLTLGEGLMEDPGALIRALFRELGRLAPFDKKAPEDPETLALTVYTLWCAWFAPDPQETARRVVEALARRNLHISFAESCTGGLAAGHLIDVPAASSVIDGSLVTYANDVKVRELGVLPETIEAYGVVSTQVAREMAEGVARHFGSQVGASVTGVAGPGGGTEKKPVGTVCFGVFLDGKTHVWRQSFGDLGRPSVRRASVNFLFARLLELLE